jgi:hypothetical protein
MKKIALTLSLALASLLGANAFAQTSPPGDDAPNSAGTRGKVSKAEKAANNEARKAEGKAVAKATTPGDDMPNSAGTRKKLTKAEKKALNAKRRAEGAEAARGPKDKSGPN